MPDRRGAAVLDDLPDDIIVDKILILLPPKDIGRCRVVRTSWRSATSTPEFLVEHRRRQPSLPIIDGKGRPASFVVLRDAVAAGVSSQQLWPLLTRCRKSCCEIFLHASSDGFLIVSRGVRFYICNPTTRKHALLPFTRLRPDSIYINDSYIHGLYQIKSTGEYRVLWSRLANGHKKQATLHILTVGDSESRSIEVILPTLSKPSLEETYKLIYRLAWLAPVHQHGNLHWFLFRPNYISGSTGDIVVFDTEAESFRWMSSPAHEGLLTRLFDMKGTLAFLSDWTPDYTALDVWVMQDYAAEIWALKYRIDVSTIEASRPLDITSVEEKKKKRQPLDSTMRYFSDLTVLNDHELLIRFNEKHVLRCDIDGKFLGMVTIGKRQYCMGLTMHRLQESIMPIPSGEIQEEDEEFPFSTEHA